MAGKPAARVQIRGAKELRAAMLGAQKDLGDWTTVHRRAAEPVQRSARSGVPVVTGALMGSLGIVADKAGAKVTAGSGVVPYAGPIHFGWPAHNIEAQPFLYDAAEDSEQDAFNVYDAEVDKLVRKIDAMTPDR